MIITYIWNLKYGINEPIYKTDSKDIENRPVASKGEKDRGRKDWELGISRCKLLYIGWINNKVLLYSTGNYIQYRVITHNGKEYLKNRMSRDFPGHPVVKTLPFHAGGAGLIPGELRSHMLWGITKIFFKKKNVYVSNWVTSLYSRDWHNIVNQLYFN